MTLSRRRSMGLLLVTCALCYGSATGGTFHYDDFHSIVENRAVRDLGKAPGFFIDPGHFSSDPGKAMYRPVLLLTYALNHAMGEYEALWWLATNLGLHAVAVVLLWALSLRLTGDPWSSLAAGLLFAVHPLTAEPVNYVSSRSESLAAVFYLAALLTYLRDRGRRRVPGVSLSFFAAALLCKSTAITLPLALVVYELLASSERLSWAGAVRTLRSLAIYAVAAVIYVAIIAANGFLGRSLAAPVRTTQVQLATQIKAAVYYLKLLLMPWGQSVEHQFFEAPSVGDPVVMAAGALGLSLLGLVAWGARRRHGAVAIFAVLWGAVVLLPTSIIPLNVLVNERRVYLVVAALALGLGALLRRRELRLAGLAIPLLALLALGRTPVWASERSLWSEAVARSPAMPRAQMNLGKAYQQEGQWEAALGAYQRALELDPGRGEAYSNIGTLLHERGDVDGAISWYRRGIDSLPAETAIYLNLAQALASRGDLTQALEVYREALSLDPEDGMAWSNYAECLLRARDWAAAEEAGRRAVALAPELAEAHNNLGNALSAQGDDAAAVVVYRRGLARASHARPAILANLGDSHRRLGDYAAARLALRESLAEDPGQATAHYYLGKVEADAGAPTRAAAALRRAVGRQPDLVGALVELAEIEAGLGHTDEAVQRLGQVLELEPGNARAWFALAGIQDSLGRASEALEAYRRFSRLWDRRDKRWERAKGRIHLLEGGG